MTIRRKYSLPNCTLILEGLSDGTANGGGQLDARPVMTILVNAECHFTGIEQFLSGGREFLDSLVRTVSSYAQEFLSKVRHPQFHEDKPNLVQLEPVKDKNLHRLSVLPAAAAVSATASSGRINEGASPGMMQQGTPVQITLTTVQLFDLVEAIDQFVADRCTLPDLSVSLQPLSKRYRQGDQPLVQRTAPATMGVASLAIAAIAFFFVPIPEVREPKPVESQTSSETTSKTREGESQETAKPRPTPPSADELEEVLASAQEIIDPTELSYLQLNLRKKLNKDWENRGRADRDLEYQVSVARDGDIIGYKPIKDTPVDAAEQTPLPDLLYIPATGGVANREEIALFRVVFTDSGVLQISPWRGRTGTAGLGPEITEPDKLQELNQQMREQILEKWEEKPAFPQELVYRVGVTEDGVIADYEPINTPAWDYMEDTPLDSLTKPGAAGIGTEGAGFVPQKPLAQFRVVFTPDHTLEISPWGGYR